MLEVVRGQTKYPSEIAQQLVASIESLPLDGILFLGYPVIASADSQVDVDALLVSREHGLVAFDVEPAPPPASELGAWDTLKDHQDRLFFLLKANLERNDSLRRGRELAVRPEVITVFPTLPPSLDGAGSRFVSVDGVASAIRDLPPLTEGFWEPLNAVVQRVTTIKPAKKREGVTRPTSRGAVMKRIDKEIANLDRWQNAAAIEMPEGPQRIRGLAGSGKTVVLALKAAYLHTQHPDWAIAVVFYSRSLYQQFTDLIRRFTFEHAADEPNWQKLQVLHAWGGSDRAGLYSEMARALAAPARDFNYGRANFRRGDEFRGVCQELLDLAEQPDDIPELFDAILIDEGQDLPEPFFQLAHKFARNPKRVVFAYDELQKLSESTMASTRDLFGVDANSEPRVDLRNTPGMPRSDITLPRCYRNTPWTLALAHALGFGTDRDEGLVQHFDDPQQWESIGYEVTAGRLEAGAEVTLARSRTSYPDYFTELLNPDDAIVTETFESERDQAEWIADRVSENLGSDELEADDILIVLPDAYTSRSSSRILSDALSARKIESHLAGVTSSADELFARNSVAIANIYRSKGNEAPVVYVANSQQCQAGHELLRLRNTLFTAITRSRAWVRICGWGPDMNRLAREIARVTSRGFTLRFRVPTADELQRMRMLHRDRTEDELARIKQLEHTLRDLMRSIQAGDIDFSSLPPDLRTSIARLLGNGSAESNDIE
jgi:superfamily I DNA and RNA helicase